MPRKFDPSTVKRIAALNDTEFSNLKSGQCYLPHTHPTFSIGTFREGWSDFWVGKASGRATPGKVVVFNPEEVHHCKSEEGVPQWNYLNFYPDVDLMRQVAAQCSDKNATFPEFRSGILDDPVLAKLLIRFLDTAIRGSGKLALESAMLDAVSRLVVHHGERAAKEDSIACEPVAVKKTLEYLEAEANLDSVDLASLAKIAGFSSYHFLRTFQKTVGLTPHAYITQLKVRRAKALILNGTSISDAAHQSGFSDQSHFTRHFKRIHGFTPGQLIA